MEVLIIITMKNYTLAVLLALSGCQSSSHPAKEHPLAVSETKVVHGLGDDDLNFLGQRLGCRVEALGMSDYLFQCDHYAFHVLAHNDTSARGVTADQPVVLRYEPSARKLPLESQLVISRGVTLAAVEEHFRSFIRTIENERKTGKRR